MSVPILLITDLQRPVFLINSRQSLSSATCSSQATLLPKLRVYFAEFLNAGSLARLRILSSPTCVGLRYGPCQVYLRDCFSAPGSCVLRLPVGRLPLTARLGRRIFLSTLNALPLGPELPFSGNAPPHASSPRTPTEVREYRPVSHRLRFSASS